MTIGFEIQHLPRPWRILDPGPLWILGALTGSRFLRPFQRRTARLHCNAMNRVTAILLGAMLLCSCDNNRDYYTRMAVKGLATAPVDMVRSQTAKVVAKGSHALPDIEQEFHGADNEGRKRLLEALRLIKDPAALPFVRYVARRDDDDKVRKDAARVARALAELAPKSPAPPPGASRTH